MICIWIVSKFYSDSNGVHVKSIRGHLRGQKRSNWGPKGHFEVKNSKNGQMHMIYIWIDSKFYFESNDVHSKVIRGHLRGQKRSKWGPKGHCKVKNSKHGQMHMIYIWIDRKFCLELNYVHLKISSGNLKGRKRSFWGHKSETRPNTHAMHMIRFQI